jgi:hypothetical protein
MGVEEKQAILDAMPDDHGYVNMGDILRDIKNSSSVSPSYKMSQFQRDLGELQQYGCIELMSGAWPKVRKKRKKVYVNNRTA